MKKLPREFYNRETTKVARELLGCYLVHRTSNIERVGKIVEVEAYLGQHDLAAHSSKGLTKRTAIMYGPPGYAYVYLIYGIHHCLNVVTDAVGSGSAILIRALEPVANLTERTQGPGLVCRSMMIDKTLNGTDLMSDTLFITKPPHPKTLAEIIETPRIGVHYAKEWAHKLLRFYIKGNAFVSQGKFKGYKL
ncbi:MAG: DNA-3-methyladenine glycosylase [Tatlockia sp.]|nr:DNA-3-methyladenine glycosylase [Tatlockia sp.]